MSNERGKWIVFEGGEHVGKSTQAALLAEILEPSIQLREPGGTPEGEAIRKMLLDTSLEFTPLTQVALHAAQRSQLYTEKIQPALQNGTHVISDRSWISSVAYQGALGISHEQIMQINGSLIHGKEQPPTPDLLILLDADPNDVWSRTTTKNDTYEQKDADFHIKVREGFHAVRWHLATLAVGKIVTIDAAESVEAIHRQVQEATIELGLPLEEEIYR